MRLLYRLLTLTCLLMMTSLGQAAELRVQDARASASFPMAQTAAVYMTLHNTSDSQRRLMAVSVDKGLADDAQLHVTKLDGDMMRMREVTEGLSIAANDSATLARGGYHIMLLGLHQRLMAGETFPLTLTFDSGDALTVTVAVDAGKGEEKQPHHHSGH